MPLCHVKERFIKNNLASENNHNHDVNLELIFIDENWKIVTRNLGRGSCLSMLPRRVVTTSKEIKPG